MKIAYQRRRKTAAFTTGVNGSALGSGTSQPSGQTTIEEIVDSERIARRPMVSVLMVTYNHEKFIADAIDGVVQQQTEFPFELVIGDDGSTDSTRDIARNYQKRFPEQIRIIVAAQNTGLRKNGRRVREAACGKYVAYCDGDDFWHDPHKLQKQIEFLEAHPDYTLVHSNYHTHYVSRNRRINNCILNGPLNDADGYHEILANRRKVLTVTVCLRRNLLRRVADEQAEIADPAWPFGDTQTWLEVARLGKVKYFPESLATYRYLPESASQSGDPQRVYRFRLKVRELMLHYIIKYSCPPSVEREAKAFNAVCIMRDAYYARERALMKVLLEDARGHYATIPVENWLYYFGAKNRITRGMVAPALLAFRILKRLRRQLGCSADLRRRRIRPFSEELRAKTSALQA